MKNIREEKKEKFIHAEEETLKIFRKTNFSVEVLLLAKVS